MRTPFIAGNWKMNPGRSDAAALARSLVEGLAAARGSKPTEVAVFPPAAYLEAVGQALRGSAIALGGQNMHHQPNGAYTGEISASMLLDFGCKHVILGHSERRQYFHETDADVYKKTQAALQAGLVPVVCVGETLDQRKANRTQQVIADQFGGSVGGLEAEEISRCILAYEPVWAIGTGVVATPEQAQEVHADLRKMLAARYNPQVATTVRLLYGGSVNAQNAADLLRQEDVDGALVGGASLKSAEFLKIVASA